MVSWLRHACRYIFSEFEEEEEFSTALGLVEQMWEEWQNPAEAEEGGETEEKVDEAPPEERGDFPLI